MNLKIIITAMQPATDTDYKKMFSELIKKQMLILGPDITLAKVKNVPGVEVDATGEVIAIQGDPQATLQGLINQFVELSGMIVKKTMESILTAYPALSGTALPSMMGMASATSAAAVAPTPPAAPPPFVSTVSATPVVAPVASQPVNEPAPISSTSMDDLNHALDQLANSPIGSEPVKAGTS